jgi:hypothetical protein
VVYCISRIKERKQVLLIQTGRYKLPKCADMLWDNTLLLIDCVKCHSTLWCHLPLEQKKLNTAKSTDRLMSVRRNLSKPVDCNKSWKPVQGTEIDMAKPYYTASIGSVYSLLA